MVKSFFISLLLLGASANALVGVKSLETKLFEQSPELSSLQKQVESKEALYSSRYSSYLPTLNAVGGWQQTTVDDPTHTEKGTVGYIEGKYNLFNGFKDSSASNQKDADLQLAKLELLQKQREFRISVTETLSEMIYLHQLQNILAEEYRTVQTQKQMAEKKVAAGLTGPVDNLEFSLRESEIQIEQNQIDQQHNESHQKLVKLFGSDLADSELDQIKYQDQAELVQIPAAFNPAKNLDYQMAEQTFSKAQQEKSELRSDFLPKLDLTASVGRLTPSENTPVQFNESRYGVTLTIPLFSGFDTYYKVKAANLNILSAEKTRSQKNMNIQAEFNILKNKIAALDKLYKINELKIENSEKYFNLTLGEYRRGVKNSPDLVSATERLFSTKKKRYEILKDLELLKVKIDTI